MTDSIDYNKAMQAAMRGLVADVLGQVAESGLPGKHHFYITFDTRHSGVDMSPALKARFPAEMTIVMQDWFENLAVMNDRFCVTLNFGNVAEPLVIPFEAMRTFVDPSVEFGLRFEAPEAPKPVEVTASKSKAKPAPKPDRGEAAKGNSAVVSLDAFRKT